MQTTDPTIAIAATFTPDPVVPAIEGMLGLFGRLPTIKLASYDQLARELIARDGVFARNAGGVNVALVRLADLGLFAGRRNEVPDHDVMRRRARELGDLISGYGRREGAAPLLVCVCPEPRGLLADRAHAALAAELEAHLANDARDAGAAVVTSDDLLSTYPVEVRDDLHADELAHIPYTPELFAALGAMIARKVRARFAAPFKVLALDADNTLWTGVLGEDGPSGVVVDDGRAEIQRFAVQQREAGALLCLCSKNVTEDVEDLFRRRAMPLERRHVTAMRVNWQAKSENLRSIAAELSLGLDAFVFLDDSFVECAEVLARAPEVLAIHLPQDSAAAASLLRHVWAFDRWGVTREDAARADRYAENAEREKSLREAPSMADFMASLDLEVRIGPPEPGDIARVSQLTFRTNQLNFTTVRRSEAEIRESGLSCLKVEVRDRFGDHGLVGVVLFEGRGDAIVVDTFLLSCRVLHRGVEHRMLARLGEIARERGLVRVDAPIVFAAKNQPARDLLESVGERWIEPRDDGFVVRFPASDAATLTYDPDAARPPPAEPRESPAPRSIGARDHAAIEAIARDFTSAAAILAHVAPSGARRARPASAGVLVAPRTAEERALAAICEEAIGVSPVGVTDDLFLDLGADSLMAARIAASMRAKLARAVEVVTVQEARTVERLAAARRPVTAAGGRSPSIHALRREGSKRPLFLARPATRSGGALSYAALARHIDPDRPVYVFQNRPYLDGTAPYESVEEMAAEYIGAMREVAPHGPYLLGGWCLGGKTAFEMASRLLTKGESVQKLVLFDTAPPLSMGEQASFFAKRELTRAKLLALARAPWLSRLLPWMRVARSRSMMARFGVLAYYMADDDDVRLIEHAFPGRFDGAELREMSPVERWQLVYGRLRAEEGNKGDEGDAATARRGYKYFARDHRIDALYSPPWVYPGHVTMMIVRGSSLAHRWKPLLSRPPIVHEVDAKGNVSAPDAHNAMMSEENVKLLAPELNRLLGRD